MDESSLHILHVDMDAFYASVEVRDNPSLAGLPVCVGGPASGRGVISAASYEARAFGIHSAMPSAMARRLCPDIVLLPPDFDRYTEASRRIMGIFRSYTPLVEPLSLDEAFLDVKGCERLLGNAVQIGQSIKREILRETGLVASVGVAPSKFLAKLASDLEKPNGFCVIQSDEIREVLDPLPVSKIFGVGERTAKRLGGLGIETVGDLASKSRQDVVKEFGASGAWIHDLAHGIDARRVTPRREEKSHGCERTFAEDIEDREELRVFLLQFCEEVAYGLRSKGLRGRTITLKARYSDFKTITRTKTLGAATNLGPRIYSVVRELFERINPGPLRLVGIQVSNLEDVRKPVQSSLFEGVEPAPGEGRSAWIATNAKLERATTEMDKLRRRFGKDVVKPGTLIGRPIPRGLDGTGKSRRSK
ncbi:MAG: DNA polymerase-4 [Planctomycetota bacterium]|jgi:DNA polymerase-4